MKAPTTDVHYVFVCQGKNCLGRGAGELLSQLRARLARDEAFRVVPFICFGACSAAPNIAVFPDRLWYSMVVPEQHEALIHSIAKREEIPDLARHVSADLKDLVFRLLGKPFRV
jgi:NADH:ubiquinone oxidoreductase subunit E